MDEISNLPAPLPSSTSQPLLVRSYATNPLEVRVYPSPIPCSTAQNTTNERWNRAITTSEDDDDRSDDEDDGVGDGDEDDDADNKKND